MFSLSEIWKHVQKRLVSLNLIKDPDADSEGESSSDISENDDLMDIMRKKQSLFQSKGGPARGGGGLGKKDQMVLKKMTETVLEHEKYIKQLKEMKANTF